MFAANRENGKGAKNKETFSFFFQPQTGIQKQMKTIIVQVTYEC